ncbi:glycosyltransferase [Thalassospira sp. MCCC 1A01428]|uniref:glycosyltransferase n=1 Tax=Thalassospira sp. MCCC 1A01428 TaxID=1470575 RepID=UPI000A1F4D3D|nr:glycosyltransferase [Thalassospira sp. MCCC 1A01428]OSQ41792.1 hypothetical protein THS27_17595 [Thalassospira sp. MCCC 1A01428]
MTKIKILHVSGADIYSGAGRGAYWLHKALITEGIESIFTSPGNINNNENEIFINPELLTRKSRIEKLRLLPYAPRKRDLFSTGRYGINLLRLIEKENPDIVHLHWINNSMISINDIKKINTPIVWTVRDMWPFTGGCHYSLNCSNYITGCGNCRILRAPKTNDISSQIYEKKNEITHKIHYVFISKWLEKEAKKTNIIKRGKSTHYIANSVNIKLFPYLEKNKARKTLKIESDRKIVLCGAINQNAIYKGYIHIKKISKIKKKLGIQLYSFGEVPNEQGIFDYNFGKIRNDEELSKIYAMADCYLMPSTQEAFGKTAVEAISSGTPVIAFDDTGLEDIVEHKFNGYLAQNNSTTSLINGIEWVLNNFPAGEYKRSYISEFMRKFDVTEASQKYISLYRKILNRN